MTSAGPNITDCPSDVLNLIGSYLDIKSIVNMRKTCKSLRLLAPSKSTTSFGYTDYYEISLHGNPEKLDQIREQDIPLLFLHFGIENVTNHLFTTQENIELMKKALDEDDGHVDGVLSRNVDKLRNAKFMSFENVKLTSIPKTKSEIVSLNNVQAQNIENLRGVASVRMKFCNFTSFESLNLCSELYAMSLNLNNIRFMQNLIKAELIDLPLKTIQGLEKIEFLIIKRCNDLTEISNLKSLKRFTIIECGNVFSISNMESMKVLMVIKSDVKIISGCKNLATLMVVDSQKRTLPYCTDSFMVAKIEQCNNLQNVEGIRKASAVQFIHCDMSNIDTTPLANSRMVIIA
jgi:hypothetical protein